VEIYQSDLAGSNAELGFSISPFLVALRELEVHDIDGSWTFWWGELA